MTRATRYTFVVLFFLYISQSIPANFFLRAFQVILREGGVSLQLLGLMNLLMLPVVLKVFWAPYVDRIGTYKSWITPMQFICLMIMMSFAFFDWVSNFWLLFGLAFFYTVASATQDIGVDGIAVRALSPKQRPVGTSVAVAGTYIGTFVGAGAMMILYSQVGLEVNILIMMIILAIPIVLLTFYREPPLEKPAEPVSIKSLWRVFARKDMRIWYLVLLSFGMPSLMAGAMLSPMLVDLGVGIERQGIIFGVIFPVAGILGCVLAPWCINRLGRRLALITAGLLFLLQIASYYAMSIGLIGTGRTMDAAFVVLGAIQGFTGILIYAIVMDKSMAESAGTDFTAQATVYSLGIMITASISGVLAQHLGYGGLFGLAFVLQLGLLALVVFYVKAKHLARPDSSAEEAAELKLDETAQTA